MHFEDSRRWTNTHKFPDRYHVLHIYFVCQYPEHSQCISWISNAFRPHRCQIFHRTVTSFEKGLQLSYSTLVFLSLFRSYLIWYIISLFSLLAKEQAHQCSSLHLCHMYDCCQLQQSPFHWQRTQQRNPSSKPTEKNIKSL